MVVRYDKPPKQFDYPKLLLVEGKTPLDFFDALTQKLGLQDIIEIRNFGGVSELRPYLKTIPKVSSYSVLKSIGICRDAETDATAAKR